MIPTREIREEARRSGVPESTIERDYAQNWVLASLPEMALKGGTGIRKVYIEDYRFSDDLDFTLLEKVERKTLEEQIIRTVENARRNSGIDFDKNVKLKEIENGYEATIYFRILRRTGAPLKIKIDITKKENEILLLPIEKRSIIHSYSDKCKVKTSVYCIDEILAEKIRSLFERTRPRDLYDVWCLKRVGRGVEILHRKCEFKHVQMNSGNLMRRREDFERAWEVSLRQQLRDIPEFKQAYKV